MFCSQCGTRAATSNQRYCPECGNDRTVPSTAAPASGPAPESARGPVSPPYMAYTPVVRVDHHHGLLRPLLLLVGAFMLLPLLIPLAFGSLVAGVVLIGFVLKALPLLALCAFVAWFVSRRQGARHGFPIR